MNCIKIVLAIVLVLTVGTKAVKSEFLFNFFLVFKLVVQLKLKLVSLYSLKHAFQKVPVSN